MRSETIKTEMSIFVLHTHVFLHIHPQGDLQAKNILNYLEWDYKYPNIDLII